MYLILDLLFIIQHFYFSKCSLYYHEKLEILIIYNNQLNRGITIKPAIWIELEKRVYYKRGTYICMDLRNNFRSWEYDFFIDRCDDYIKIRSLDSLDPLDSLDSIFNTNLIIDSCEISTVNEILKNFLKFEFTDFRRNLFFHQF